MPVILAAVERKDREGERKRIIVSTHTISLQEQLIGKDVPFLNAVLPIEFSAVLAKGRTNYVSLRRMKAAGERAQTMFADESELNQLRLLWQWTESTTDGSRADLDFRPLPSRLGRSSQRARQLPRETMSDVQGLPLLRGAAARLERRPDCGQPRPVFLRPRPPP